jgi:predicted nucleotidyltransferase
LDQFGFGALGIGLEDLTTPDRVLQLGFPPRRIDLLTSIDGVQFAPAFTARITVEVDGQTLNFISLEDFKINKRSTGRNKDLADLDALGESPKK